MVFLLSDLYNGLALILSTLKEDTQAYMWETVLNMKLQHTIQCIHQKSMKTQQNLNYNLSQLPYSKSQSLLIIMRKTMAKIMKMMMQQKIMKTNKNDKYIQLI